LDISIAEPIVLEHGGRRGPSKKVDPAFLREAMDPRRRIPLVQLANKLGIHRNTLRYYLKAYNVDNQFSAISDADLDILVKTFRETKPDSGLRYLVGFLVNMGLKYKANGFGLQLHVLITLAVLCVAGARKRLSVESITFRVQMPFGI
jgi:hypothetical protein